MRMKSETFTCLANFCAMVKNQFNRTIKHLRTDNGQEFLSNNIQKKFHDHGILHERTCVDTPQQNGIAKRKHCHLFNVARCLRFQANLPISFWGECILTAPYLINHTPSPHLNHKSPYELLFQKQPSYSHLRVFGCLCYAQTTRKNCDKVSPRALRCVFLGYPIHHKAYRVYDLEYKNFFISRDVTFQENIFPYHLMTPDPTPSPVLPLPIPEIPSNIVSAQPTTSPPFPSSHEPSSTSSTPPLPTRPK